MNKDTPNKEQVLVSEAETLTQSLQNYVITTPAKYETASTDLKTAKSLIKAIEDRRKEMTQPLDQSKKKIMGFFKPSLDKLNSIVSKINSEMFTFRRQQEAEAEKIRKENEKAAGEGEVFTPDITPEIPKTDVKVRKVWKFKVTDINKVDRKFLIVDEKTVGELVRKLEKKAEDIVGGIEVYYTETTY